MIKLRVHALVPGMILAKNVTSPTGGFLIGRGVKLNSKYISQLLERGVDAVEILEPGDLTAKPQLPPIKKTQIYKEVEINTTESLQTIFDQIIRTQVINTSIAYFNQSFQALEQSAQYRKRLFAIIDDVLIDMHVISYLSIIKAHSPGSIQRYSYVLVFSLLIGLDMGLEKNRLLELGKAALLYNIGHFIRLSEIMRYDQYTPIYQIKIPTNENRTHMQIGYDTLKVHFEEEVARVALDHHERFAGGGIPNNKSGSELYLQTKIVSVVSKFITLRYSKNNKQPIGTDLAIDYILNSEGLLFDPNVVNTFRKFIFPYGLGSIIELFDGSRGIVIKTGTAPDYYPIVKMIITRTSAFHVGQFVNTNDLEESYIKKIYDDPFVSM